MKVLWILCLLFLVSCVPSASSDKTTTTGNINADAPYLWSDKAFPKTVKVSDAFGVNETANFTAMSTAWKTALADKVTFFAYGAVTPEITNVSFSMSSLLDSTMGIYKTTRWPSSLSGTALAVTQIFGRRYNVGDSDEFVNIEHADILVNYDLYHFDTTDSGTGFDLRTVVLHEMGHFLGLQHKAQTSTRSASVMYPSIDADEAKRTPQAVDISDMVSKYRINLGTGAAYYMTADSMPTYEVKTGDVGAPESLQIELHAHGECVHRLNGVIVKRHSADLSKN
jgi:Matrixin